MQDPITPYPSAAAGHAPVETVDTNDQLSSLVVLGLAVVGSVVTVGLAMLVGG